LVRTAIVLALAFTGAGDDVVLCLGGDGHVAIESVGPEGCVEVAETVSHAAAASAISASSSHCGPCVDVALTASSTIAATSAAERTDAAPALISIATPGPATLYLRAAIPVRLATHIISEKPYTVVIRC
jgi:hypothetical protein